MRRIWTVFPVFLILCFASGCAKKVDNGNVTSVNMAFQNWVGYGPFYLAQDKGFCREEGVELNFVDEPLDSARMVAFKEGMLDFEGGTLDLLVSKVAGGAPIVAVMEIDTSFGSDAIVAAADIKTLDDLEGKSVVLARDDVGETFLSYLFYKKGITLDKVKMVSYNSEFVAEAFLKGEAEACVTWEPQVSEALKRPGAHILASTREYPDVIIDTLNVRRDLLEKDPDLVKGLMRAWFKALKYYRDEPEEASAIIAAYYGITPEEYRKQVEGLLWKSYEEQKGELAKKWIEVFDLIAKIKVDNKRIILKPEATASVNRKLLERLYEDSE